MVNGDDSVQDLLKDHPRLHVPPDADMRFADDDVLPLTPAAAHYLGSVLRRQPGGGVRLFNHLDGEWQGTIESLRKDRGSVRLRQQLRQPASEPGPVLLFAPLKRDATDLVVRMATELGVAVLAPVLTERSNTTRINAERWIAIAAEAAEQCERLTLPEIRPAVRLTELLSGWDPGRPLLAALERAHVPDRRITPAAWRQSAPPDRQPGLLVGPEGGFSDVERRLLEACGFVVPVRLGRLILRAETACAAGLAGLAG